MISIATLVGGKLEPCEETLVLHGDDDQIAPIGANAVSAAKLVKNSKLVVYAGALHGLTDPYRDKLNVDLLAFVKGDA